MSTRDVRLPCRIKEFRHELLERKAQAIRFVQGHRLGTTSDHPEDIQHEERIADLVNRCLLDLRDLQRELGAASNTDQEGGSCRASER